ncbi:MAG: response regulator [Cyanobacteria bacterium J06632_22]
MGQAAPLTMPTPSAQRSDEPFILVVDDEPANLSLLKEALSPTGLKVRVATNGIKALEISKVSPPQLILLDIAMPGMDGFETCQRLKAEPATANIPVIFASAFSAIDQKVKGFTVGAVDYITKPFHVEEVLARVKAQLKLQSLTEMLRHKNEKLETEIQARTRAEAQLQQKFQELQDTQTQLIQAKKMSSLGQMVAGIAHEINNPASFILGNVSHARSYFDDLLDLLHLYEEHGNHKHPDISAKIQEIELSYLKTDLYKLLESIEHGGQRIRDIVLCFKNFSRLDEEGYKTVDLRKGLDSTLMLLQHHFQNSGRQKAITIQKEYTEIPSIYCNPKQINQVFLQIFTNAIEALALSHSEASPSIHIGSSTVDDQSVRITISNNGPAIRQDAIEHIFDPFFTTKPVGSGKGLGLAIAYQIVTEQHNGQLYCNMHLEHGAQFVIELPIEKPLDAPG